MNSVAVSMPSLWTGFEAAAATGGQLCGEAAYHWAVSGISIDTRTINAGDLFVALTDTRDGHDFIADAVLAGAALVSRVPDGIPKSLPLLKVADTLAAVRALAAAARDRCFGKLIAVTGSAGKTSTKEMLRSALAPAGRVHAAARSFNNHIGVPLTLASLPGNAAYGVFEIGMNHSGEIMPLTRLVQPHVAIITTVAAAHLEHFNSIDEIASAKAEIFEGVRQGGTVVLPADNSYYEYLCDQAKVRSISNIIPFGEGVAANQGVRLVSLTPQSDGTSQVRGTLFGEPFAFVLHSVGRHQAMNAMAVLAATHAIGVPPQLALDGIAQFTPDAGRGASRTLRINGGEVTILDESYNANPASMAAAFDVLAATEPRGRGRRIAVLGEMKELGPKSDELHAAVAGPIAKSGTALVLTAGAALQTLRTSIPTDISGPHAEVAVDLLDSLAALLRDGDVVLFKGSNGSQVGKLVAALLAKSGEQA